MDELTFKNELPPYGHDRELRDAVRDVVAEMQAQSRENSDQFEQTLSAMSKFACTVAGVAAVGTTTLFAVELYGHIYGAGWPLVTSMPWVAGGFATSLTSIAAIIWTMHGD